MRNILLILLFTFLSGTNFAQVQVSGDTTSIGDQSGNAKTVFYGKTQLLHTPAGSQLDSILATGTDGAVKFIPTSVFGPSSAAYIISYLKALPGYAPGRVLRSDFTWVEKAGSSSSTYDIQLTDAQNNIIHQTNSLADMRTYLSTYTIASDIILQFNTSAVYPITARWLINYTNGTHRIKLRSKAGERAVIDCQDLDNTVLTIGTNHVDVENLTLKNANPLDNAGTIIRHDGAKDCTFNNLTLDRGYCATRGTLNTEDLIFNNLVIRNVVAGSFRMGNGLNTFPDAKNITITNITMEDPMNGANITGTTLKFSPLILMKHTLNALIENITFPDNINSDGVAIESGNTIKISKVRIDGVNTHNGITTIGNTNIEISNCFVRSTPGVGNGYLLYMTQDEDIKLYHNTMAAINSTDGGSIVLYNVKSVTALEGNIAMGNDLGPAMALSFSPAGTLANKFLSDKYNSVANKDQWSNYMSIQGITDLNGGAVTRIPFDVSIADWQNIYGRGQGLQRATSHSGLILGTRNGTGKTFYLQDTSIGRNNVAVQLGGLTQDALGGTRTVPGDAGATDKDSN